MLLNKSFSILISVYIKESPNCLEECFNSIFENTVRPSEIVLIKDGPLTKELNEVVSFYSKQYPIFKIIEFERNQGLGKALHEGLLACSNELIARVDADDINLPDRFEKQLNFMYKNPQISVLGGSIKEFDKNPNEPYAQRILPCVHKDILQFMKSRCPFNHMTVMYRKSEVLNAGNYQPFHLMEDYFLWLRMALQNSQFANLNEPLVLARGGLDMLGRRGGLKYVRSELNLLKFMHQNKFISSLEYVIYGVLKTSVRLMGKNMRGIIYKLFLRN